MRSSLDVTRSVWYALFMREVLVRTTADRMAWFWMLLEPIAHVALLSGLRSLIGDFKLIAGAPVVPWLVVGLMTFFSFRDGVIRSLGAVKANKGLFTYRQVKPVDTVLVRCWVEGLLKFFIFVIMITALCLLGFDAYPHSLIEAISLFFLVWLFGVGVGLLVSVGSELVPELEKIIRIAMFPLYLVSGVLFPINFLPPYLQKLILINPVVHGIESCRLAFFHGYWSLDGISVSYLAFSSLVLIVLGLLLHIRFSERLKAL